MRGTIQLPTARVDGACITHLKRLYCDSTTTAGVYRSAAETVLKNDSALGQVADMLSTTAQNVAKRQKCAWFWCAFQVKIYKATTLFISYFSLSLVT